MNWTVTIRLSDGSAFGDPQKYRDTELPPQHELEANARHMTDDNAATVEITREG